MILDRKYVFVATDEPKVLTELKLRYPNFKWISRKDTVEASMLRNRYSDHGQDAIIKDIFVLAYSDFIVSFKLFSVLPDIILINL